LIGAVFAGIVVWLSLNGSFYFEGDHVNMIAFGNSLTTVVTETSTFTSIYSYTVTSTSTSSTTTTSITAATQTIVTVSTLRTTTTTTATATFWRTETSTSITWRTSTSIVPSTSLITVTLTNTSTLLYPTVTSTSMNTSYQITTVFSPTVTVVSTQTSAIPVRSTATLLRTTTTTTMVTEVVARPCVIVSAAYGSELVPQVQILREFRDNTVGVTLAGAEFMRVFNAFYYSFSPAVADAIVAKPILASMVRMLIRPMIAALYVASWVFCRLPLSPELAAILVGVVASGLIGAIYGTPLAFFMTLRRKAKIRHITVGDSLSKLPASCRSDRAKIDQNSLQAILPL